MQFLDINGARRIKQYTDNAINDLNDKLSSIENITIPSNVSDLTNDSRFTSNGNAKIFYGTCSTSGSSGSKQVTCNEFTSADLVSGVLIYVKFDNTNTASRTDLSMKVANTSYKPIKQILNGGLGFLTSNDNIIANTTYLFQYDGTYWLYMNIDQVHSDWNATSGMGVIFNKPDIPSESTVSGWGFTKNSGTYSKPSDGIPATDLTSAVQTSLGKADTALQSFTETDPTVPSWAKQSTKPTYTASEVGALPDTTVIPTVPTNVSAFTNDANYVKYVLCADEAAYNAISNKDSGTLYLIPKT